jgi:hypothetical protein
MGGIFYLNPCGTVHVNFGLSGAIFQKNRIPSATPECKSVLVLRSFVSESVFKWDMFPKIVSIWNTHVSKSVLKWGICF